MSSTSPELTLPDRNEIIRAGAGAGKTTTLIDKILGFAEAYYDQYEQFPKVAVTTFTRKATQEIRERLMKKACEKRPKLLEFVTSRSYLSISTIHGFLNLFLKKYGKIISLDLNFKIVDGEELDIALKKIIRDEVVSDQSHVELLEKIDFNTLLGHIKTYFPLWLSFQELKPQSAISFEVMAYSYLKIKKDSLEDLRRQIIEQTDDEKWIEFTQIANQLSQLVEKHNNYQSIYPEALSVLERLKTPRKNSKNPKVDDQLHESCKALIKELSLISEAEWNPEVWPQFTSHYESFERLAKRVCEKYFTYKVENGLISVSDMESLTQKIINEHPQAADSFAAEWNYWLVDEYQDTSPIQVKILKSFIGKEKNFHVGDPQQSIYLFRGARSEVFTEKEAEVQVEGGITNLKMKNYRSDPGLLIFFNEFFQSFTNQFQSMEPKEEVKQAQTVAKFAVCKKDEDGCSELDAIASHVEQLVQQKVRLDQICIIARQKKQLNEIAQFLSDNNYPANVHISSGFFERREVKDAFQILRFLANPFDDLNLFSLLRSPWYQVEDDTLAIWAKERKTSLWSHIKDKSDVAIVEKLKEVLKDCSIVGYCQTLQNEVIQCGLMKWSQVLDPTGRREANLWKLISELRTQERLPGFRVLQFISQSTKEVSTDDSNSEGDAVAAVEPNRINLMTIHGSKGLEFDHVIVPGLHKAPELTKRQGFCLDEQSLKWSIPLFDDEEQKNIYSLADYTVTEKMKEAELAEEERLLYVAMTRAKKTIFLSWNEKVQKKSMASRFKWDLSNKKSDLKFYSYEVQSGPWSFSSFVEKDSLSDSVEKSPLITKDIILEESERISVSEILNRTFIEKSEDFNGPKTTEGLESRVRRARHGTLMHRLFETLSYQQVSENMVRDWFSEQEEQVFEALNYLLELKSPPIKEIIENGQSEWGFQWKCKGKLIEGQVDLWGVVNSELWIVDYKTGSSYYSEKAFQQLSIYAQALMTKVSCEKCFLVTLYPYEKKTIVKSLDEMQEFWKKVELVL